MTEKIRKRPVRRREAEEILKALEAGVVPKIGVQHLLVGRNKEVEEILSILRQVEAGSSDLRVWIGDFGSGKSFMLRTIEQLALSQNFVCSTVDLTPSRRFQSSDGKALALYQELVRRLQTRGAAEGEALASIFDQWVEDLLEEGGSDLSALQEEVEEGGVGESPVFQDLHRQIEEAFSHFRTGGLKFELSQCLVLYAEGMATQSAYLRMQALRWVSGQFPTKTESRKILGIGRIPTDNNWTDLLQNLSEFFIAAGYDGLVVNFDELVNLYKLPRAQSRDANYERILNLYNDCKTGTVPGLFINLAATRKTVYDERRGMASYGALKGRLGIENEKLEGLVDTTSTLQLLQPLSPEEIFTLLERLQEIFQVLYPSERQFSDQEIAAYMQAQLNRPGADEFLTPRAVIKDFIQLMQLARQNKGVTTGELLERKFGSLGAMEKDADNHDDELPTIQLI